MASRQCGGEPSVSGPGCFQKLQQGPGPVCPGYLCPPPPAFLRGPVRHTDVIQNSWLGPLKPREMLRPSAFTPDNLGYYRLELLSPWLFFIAPGEPEDRPCVVQLVHEVDCPAFGDAAAALSEAQEALVASGARIHIYIYIHTYTYIYIYIYVQRERESDIYIYIYIYICCKI